MKIKLGDKVIVIAGKDKGKQSTVVGVNETKQTITVKDANIYTRHIKPQAGRAGEKVRSERALSAGKVAILNDKGKADRVGYRVAADGTKERFFKKTGKAVPETAKTAKK